MQLDSPDPDTSLEAQQAVSVEQSGRERPAPRAMTAWIVVVLAVLGIIIANHLGERLLEQESDDTTQLTLLRLQGKLLMGLAQLPTAGAQVSGEAGKLGEQVSTARVARALAALEVGLPGAGQAGQEQARELLERFQDQVSGEDEAELHSLVLQAVEDPEQLDSSQRELLQTEMGWFAEVLLSHRQDSSDPARRQVLSATLGTALLFAGVMAAGGCAVLVGLVLLTVAFVRLSRGQLRLRLQPPSAYGAIYLQSFAVYLGGMTLLMLVPSRPELGAFEIAGLAVVSLVGSLWPVLRGVPRSQVQQDLGFHSGEGVLREVGCGLIGYVAMLPVVAVGFGLTVVLALIKQLLDAASPDQVSQPVSHPVLPLIADGTTLVRLMVLLLAVLLAPFFEEIIFRGALLAHLRRRLAALPAALVMGVLFAVIHPQGWVTIPAIASLAVGFALLREWRGSLIAAMVGHGIHNGILLSLLWVAFR